LFWIFKQYIFDYYKNELNNVYNDLNELILTGNTEYSNGKLIPNLEVILKTYIIIGSKIGKKEFNFDFFFFFFFFFVLVL